MGRWEPGARGRLVAAALELFEERGYEQTTVPDIAARAGVTARTFFRYFGDKRDVVFAGGVELEAHVVAALDAAPSGAPPMTLVETAVLAVADVLPERQWAARRQAVVVSHPELRERELTKMASLSAALAEALRRRGVDEADAVLAAEAGVLVFRVAYERWVSGPDDRGLGEALARSFAQLRGLTG